MDTNGQMQEKWKTQIEGWVQVPPARMFPSFSKEAWEVLAILAEKYGNRELEILDADFAALVDSDVTTFCNISTGDFKIKVTPNVD